MHSNDVTKENTQNTLHDNHISKIGSRQIIYDNNQPIDEDFIRDCIISSPTSKNKNRIGSNLSLNGSSVGDHINDFSDDDMNVTHSSSIHLNKVEQARQIVQEAESNIDSKNYDAAIKLYNTACSCLSDYISQTDAVMLFTNSKLGLASLYMMNGKNNEAEKELIDLLSVNKDCVQAKELMTKVMS